MNLTQHPTVDITERRLSEVTSLIDHNSSSLFEMKGNETSDERDVGVIETITKRQIENRKKALREKIERLKSRGSNHHVADAPRHECDDGHGDDLHVAEPISNQQALQLQAVDRTDGDGGSELDRMSCAVDVSSDCESKKRRQVRRRKSVITKMNEAIRRNCQKRL